MNKLYIYCDGGFGNRFNVLVAGLWISEKLGYHPIVYWPENNWCGASFRQIFEPFVDLLNTFNVEHFNNYKTLNLIHENQMSVDSFVNVKNVTNITQTKDILQGRDILYFNNLIPSFVEDPVGTCSKIKFRDDLIQIAEEQIRNNTTEEFFGIHIRKTDFGSRSDLAEKICLDIVKGNQNKKFFICSDDKETENKFCLHKNVFKFDKKQYVAKFTEGSWNEHVREINSNFNVTRSSESVTNAIVDLLILSRSTIISPDVGSTFADTAKLINKSRRILERDQA